MSYLNRLNKKRKTKKENKLPPLNPPCPYYFAAPCPYAPAPDAPEPSTGWLPTPLVLGPSGVERRRRGPCAAVSQTQSPASSSGTPPGGPTWRPGPGRNRPSGHPRNVRRLCRCGGRQCPPNPAWWGHSEPLGTVPPTHQGVWTRWSLSARGSPNPSIHGEHRVAYRGRWRARMTVGAGRGLCRHTDLGGRHASVKRQYNGLGSSSHAPRPEVGWGRWLGRGLAGASRVLRPSVVEPGLPVDHIVPWSGHCVARPEGCWWW